jgi:DNA topoisomerase-1
VTLEKALDLLAKGGEGPKSLGVDSDSGLEVFVKVGRFGPYFQLGDPDEMDGDKPKMASLLAGMDPETVALDDALAVLRLPRVVGLAKKPDGEEEEEILASNGRFGPFLKWGKDTRSIPAGGSPLTVTKEEALHLFSQPKKGRGGRTRAEPKVLKDLGEHPDSGEQVRILDGRYGPYVTDGTTNASLPKGEDPEGVGMAEAVDLLAARAARGGGKKKKAKKKTAKKTTGKKKVTKKKVAKKTAKK